VIALDDLSTGDLRNIAHLLDNPRFEFIEHDIRQPIYIPGLDLILNFACPASPIHYQKDPVKTMETNFLGIVNMLHLAKQTGARVLQASTSEVYGDPEVSPQYENYWGNVNPIGPRSVYDEAKRFGETLVAHFQRERLANAGIVRIFNTYGPNMDPYDGRVVSNFIRQALQGKPLTIYGSGEQTRSFCYIDDLVRGIMAMAQTTQPGPINLGNPEERTLLNLSELVLEITGSSSTLEFFELPEDDPKQRCPDISRARALLGWEPKVDISTGIMRTAEWISKNN
jgi:UDP-glucuronate decarboxylase